MLSPFNDFSLFHFKAEELANFYFGFNGWNSEILYHQLEEQQQNEHTYATAVRLSFKKEKDQKVEGVGLSKAKFKNATEKSSQLAMAQKNSKYAAMLNAFSKVIIVLVHTDNKMKVTSRIDYTKNDPFYYNSLWDNKPIIEVQELEDEPELEI